MDNRSKDWLRQAEKDLKHAKIFMKMVIMKWACFSCQQSAEKALKGVYNKNNRETKGHSILGLIKGLEDIYKIPPEFYYYAKVLSRYYIKTRYSNGFLEGAPMDYFDKQMAEEAINASGKILQWCRDIIFR
jgi:HEPN domain-containing protein